jgi:ABC-2 type transport system ATP-binding protein
MSDDILISVEQLSRHYGPIEAVRNISFELRRGEVLGFLGPNGAGKSTTMQMLGGNLAPSAGRICINQHDILDEPMAAKRAMGYLPEQPPLYTDLTVDEFLRYCARLHNIHGQPLAVALDRAKQRCGLNEVHRRLIGNLSKGYQQRVGIAQAILHSPDVVILDEPTVGLDPIQIREIRSLIREIGEEHSVLLSTHILPEVLSTCDRVIIINRGEIALSDTLSNLDHNAQIKSVRVGLQQDTAAEKLMALAGVERVEVLDKGYRLYGNINTSAIASEIVGRGWGLTELVAERRSLEQIFIDITCNETRSGETDEATA